MQLSSSLFLALLFFFWWEVVFSWLNPLCSLGSYFVSSLDLALYLSHSSLLPPVSRLALSLRGEQSSIGQILKKARKLTIESSEKSLEPPLKGDHLVEWLLLPNTFSPRRIPFPTVLNIDNGGSQPDKNDNQEYKEQADHDKFVKNEIKDIFCVVNRNSFIELRLHNVVKPIPIS